MIRGQLIGSAVALSSATLFAQRAPYVIAPVVVDPNLKYSFSSPVINNRGQVAYAVTKAGVGSAIVRGSDFVADAIISDYSTGPFQSFATFFQMNDNGDIVFAGKVRATGVTGVFANTNTEINLANGRVGGVSPVSLNNAGQVLIAESLGLYTYNPRRNHERVLLGNIGSETTTILADNTFNGPPENFRTLDSGQAVINASAQTIHQAQTWTDTGYGRVEGIYRGNTRATAVVETDGPLFDVDTWQDMNDAGQIAFLGSYDSNLYVDEIILRQPDGTMSVFASQNEATPNVSWIDINNNGEIVFGSYGNGGNGLFNGPGGLADRIVGPGDQLFGGTIRDAYFRRGGFNDAGQVAFHFITTDLITGIAVATPATAGDANADGNIDFNDLLTLAQHYKALGTWSDGDFDFDHVVDFSDLLLLAQHYQGAAVIGLDEEFRQNWDLARALAPEPQAVLLASLIIFRRARRHADSV